MRSYKDFCMDHMPYDEAEVEMPYLSAGAVLKHALFMGNIYYKERQHENENDFGIIEG